MSQVTCPTCAGLGWCAFDQLCDDCEGLGELERHEAVREVEREQPTLLPPDPEEIGELVPQVVAGECPLREAAAQWIKENSEAMAWLARRALERAVPGLRISAKRLCEELRDEGPVDLGEQRFKVNNNHTAYIARELIRRHPELEGVLRCRRTRDVAAR